MKRGSDMRAARKRETSLEGMTVEELLNVRAEADRVLAEKLDAERSALTEKLRALEEYEASTRLRAPKSRAGSLHAQNRGDTRGGPVRAKAAPKYRDPVSGATWAGRGQQPRWMRKALESGAHQEDFRIK
jgi:DNA-binding protein H-NS